MKPTKFIFITGGVVSSIGKGITAASIGALMEARGLKIGMQKLDPYINVDPGTMNPYQHGEVYVTEDGAETDLDLGHYERFTTAKITKKSNYTTGKIYESVINKERKGEYLGGTVQVIPHITNEIKSVILDAMINIDIGIVEIGGTVGDIESLPFLEAIRQLQNDLGRENVLFVHVTLVPYIKSAGELKTKPTQHSVKELRAIGIQPDIIVCRTDRDLTDDVKRKISLFCNVEKSCVITAKDVDTIYEVPLNFNKEGLDEKIIEKLNIWTAAPNLDKWEFIVDRIKNPLYEVNIAVVGKYVELIESYKSINEALVHGGIANNCKVNIEYIEAEKINRETVDDLLKNAEGILVPGGFGERGISGKIEAIKYARENKIPFLGICLGMQLAVIEFARNVAGLKDAHSTEFNKRTKNPVIYLMEQWIDEDGNVQYRTEETALGGTMRLGAYKCILNENSKAYEAYNKKEIYERHRHRYEFNNDFREILQEKGLKIVGLSPDDQLVEVIELDDHPWFIGCQFHPEFKSRPMDAHPLFREFVKAAKGWFVIRGLGFGKIFL